MVNFAKRFFYAVITEWRDQYIDYKSLYKQIKLVKAAVLELAQAYANIKVITGDDAGKEIQLEEDGS
jgi:SPX domain protein involved in polyphosphate accumulation